MPTCSSLWHVTAVAILKFRCANDTTDPSTASLLLCSPALRVSPRYSWNTCRLISVLNGKECGTGSFLSIVLFFFNLLIFLPRLLTFDASTLSLLSSPAFHLGESSIWALPPLPHVGLIPTLCFFRSQFFPAFYFFLLFFIISLSKDAVSNQQYLIPYHAIQLVSDMRYLKLHTLDSNSSKRPIKTLLSRNSVTTLTFLYSIENISIHCFFSVSALNTIFNAEHWNECNRL